MPTLLIVAIIASLPVPIIVFGESLARRSKGGPIKRFWRKHVVGSDDDL